jgi:hypothetical protein
MTPATPPCDWSLAGDRCLRGAGPALWRSRSPYRYVQQCAAGHIPDDVPRAVAAILARHAPAAAAAMNAFYWRPFDGDLHAGFPSV